MEGEEVVQLYISQSSQSFRVPVRELNGFNRIFLGKNEKKTISFEIYQEDYSIVNTHDERIIQAGDILISIGGSQPGFIGNASEVLKDSFKIRN